MLDELENLRRKHDGQLIGVVSHADPGRLLLAGWMTVPVDSLLSFEISPASVSVAHVYELSVQVNCLNWTEDLPL